VAGPVAVGAGEAAVAPVRVNRVDWALGAAWPALWGRAGVVCVGWLLSAAGQQGRLLRRSRYRPPQSLWPLQFACFCGPVCGSCGHG